MDDQQVLLMTAHPLARTYQGLVNKNTGRKEPPPAILNLVACATGYWGRIRLIYKIY